MFHRAVSVSFFVLFTLASASVLPRGKSPTACSTGALQCCQKTTSANSTSGFNSLFNLLGIDSGDLTDLIGFQCDPITTLGLGGNSCNSQAVCCSNNNFAGLFSLGCTAVNF